jgi:hypothetical protein
MFVDIADTTVPNLIYTKPLMKMGDFDVCNKKKTQ